MTPEELKQAIDHWQLNAAQAARVLCVHSNKMSEYLGGICRIPCALAFHVDALNRIETEARQQLFEQRIERQSHEQMALKIIPD